MALSRRLLLVEQGRKVMGVFPALQTLILSGICFAACVSLTHAQPASRPPADDESRRLIVGVWEDHYQGHRTMTVRPDGTATMVVRLNGWKAAFYASGLQFEMIWSIEQGRLKKRTTGGEPAAKVKTILKMMGDRVEEPIVDLTSTRLILLDQNGKREYHWQRVPVKS